MPRPTASASASAAGTRMPSAAGTDADASSRLGSQAHTNDRSATIHARPAHASRGPVATDERQHRGDEQADRRDAGAGRARVEREDVGEVDRRARQEAEGRRVRRRPATATTAAEQRAAEGRDRRRDDRHAPVAPLSDEGRRAARTPTTRTASNKAGGQTAHVTQEQRQAATTVCRRARDRRPAGPRMSACNTNGASAKHTSGPSSPCRDRVADHRIRARTRRRRPRRRAATARTNARARYAPNAPSGSAPPTTSERARPACPSSAVESAAIDRRTRVAAGCSAPIIA